MFAMEISVEHDMRTGESQVVSTATVTPETIQDRGVKVYDDGCKSVYALHPDGSKMYNSAVGEMTSVEVEELLRQATDKKVPSEVQYHKPVYSASYTGTSRPPTPKTPSKTPTHTPTPSSSPFQAKTVPRNGIQNLGEESLLSRELESRKTPSKSPGLIQQDTILKDSDQRQEEEIHQFLPYFITDRNLTPQPQSPQLDTQSPALVSVTARSEGMPAFIQPIYRNIDSCSPSLPGHKSAASQDPVLLLESSADSNRQSPFYPESEASLNLIYSLSEDLESEPVTMIFMGYHNAEDDDEEEDIQAELVIIGNSDDDDDDDGDGKNGKKDNGGDEFLSYHPEGYKSKVFQPKVGIAKVAGCRDVLEEAYMNCDDLLPHKPTFIHKPGKRSPCLQGQEMAGATSTGNINLEKMKLCSTGR
ncbi:palmdelphin-like [Myripristis murdjan]|uniref:palmdelphin-like n=1 Tax=Myripristis murdjan TaxID=586833 RepID=UPI0011763321|nr:palmdelphin-like [Myripristis murdjan]